MNLNNNQIIFCQEYVKNGCNGLQAYKIAYPKAKSDDTAKANAYRLLTNDYVSAYIKELQDKIKEESIMSTKDIMFFLCNIINGTEKEKRTKVVNDEEITVEREADLNMKMKAIDILNKMTGSYQTNINVNGSINNPYKNLTEEELKKLAGDL